MSSNINVSGIGSSTATVSWTSTSQGAVYTLDLLDTDGTKVTSIETQETSVVFEDLDPDSEYTFNLWIEAPVGAYDQYTSLRIDNPGNRWLSIIEIEAYDFSGKVIPATNFTLASSPLHTSYDHIGYAMNGNTDTGLWTDGAMLQASTTAFFEATLKTPTRLSFVRVYTHDDWGVTTGTTLTLTKIRGQEVVYSLEGEHAIEDGNLTVQDIFVIPVVFETYKSMTIQHTENSWLSVMEIEAYDSVGSLVPPSNFTLSSSELHSSSNLTNAVNGATETGPWTSGSILSASPSAYMTATFNTPMELSAVKIYSDSYYGFKTSSSVTMMKANGDKVIYPMSGASVETFDMDPVSAPVYEAYTTIRIDHPNTTAYLSVVEVEAYDSSGVIIPSGDFNLTSSTIYNSAYPLSRSMNGDNDNSSWQVAGTMLNGGGDDYDAYWQATLTSPRKLSFLRIYSADGSWGLADRNTLTVTKDTGVKVEYPLGGGHEVVQGNLSSQLIVLEPEIVPVVDTYTSLRIKHNNAWLCITEIEAYDSSGNLLLSSDFTLTSSGTHSDGPVGNSMDRVIDVDVWNNGAMINAGTPAHMEAVLIAPQEISFVRLFTSSGYPVKADSVMIMTKDNGVRVEYPLYSGGFEIKPGVLTDQLIVMNPSVFEYFTSLRIVHADTSAYLSVVEFEAYDSSGNILSSSDFNFTSSTIHQGYTMDRSMNGITDISTWQNGTLLVGGGAGVEAYWEANLTTPTRLSLLRVYSSVQWGMTSRNILTVTNDRGVGVDYPLGGGHEIEAGDLTVQEITLW